jgi:pilus assembly protein Flp/PilA
MKDLLFKLSFKMYLLKDVLQDARGQDLIEYALIVALIALAATAGMGTLATAINGAFTTIGTKLTTAMG